MSSIYRRVRQPLLSSVRQMGAAQLAPRSSPWSNRTPRRHATTATNTTDSLLLGRLRVLFYGSTIAASLYVIYLYTTDTRASYHRWLVPPLLRLVFPDAEDAHHAGTAALKNLYALGLHPRERESSSSSNNGVPASALAVTVFGTTLQNPIGISAGLDKDAEIPDALFALGPAVVEVGGCTPLPQEGNPRPRVFRVPGVDGMINRYGLNSRGADAMASRLRARVRTYARSLGVAAEDILGGALSEEVPPGSLLPGRLLLVQVAKNKATDERDVGAVIRDYVYCVDRLARYADVIVVNVSSPNTPGLRDLQATEPLTRLLSAVVDEAKRTERRRKPKVMVKVSPDEDDDTQIEGVVQAVWASGVDGVIVGNTTKRRTGLIPPGVRLTVKEQRALEETGGFSGPAMFDRTLSLVKKYRKVLDGHSLHSLPGAGASEAGVAAVPAVDGTVSGKVLDAAGSKDLEPEQKVIFATGGITNGQQALEMLNAGASVAMVYTGMTYGGAGTVTRIKREMRDQLAV